MGLINKKECLDNIKQELKYIKYQTKILAGLRIWQPKTSARIGDIIIKIQDIVVRESIITRARYVLMAKSVIY